MRKQYFILKRELIKLKRYQNSLIRVFGKTVCINSSTVSTSIRTLYHDPYIVESLMIRNI